MRRPGLVAAAALTAGACTGGLLGPDPDPDDPVANFETLWDEFDRQYSFFELKQVDWQAVYEQFRPRVTASTSQPELFDTFDEMTLLLRDGHVSLDTPLGRSQYTEWFELFPDNFLPEAVAGQQLRGFTRAMNGRMEYGIRPDGIAYVYINSFGGSNWAPDIDRFLEAVAAAPALIIDVRHNGGGSDRNSDQLAARFADQRRLYMRYQYRNGPSHDDFTELRDMYIEPAGADSWQKPVAVLTNRRSFSTTEEFVLAMRVLPHVTIVGDTTGGGSGNPIGRELPNGWTYRLSRWRTFTPSGDSFEGSGLAPDVPVWITPADSALGVDTILETAVALLSQE